MKINNFKNKNILITGATGSVGSALVFSLIKNYNFKVIRAMSNDENGLFELTQKLKSYNPNLTELMLKNKIRLIHGDIRSAERCMHVTNDIDIVIHAAAMKHVPICEYNPDEAISTNVVGTQNILNACIKNKVEKFILISTDKATNPQTIMGTSKLMAEKLTLNSSDFSGNKNFYCIRFGNVIGSRGSVLEIFKNQILNNVDLTVTHKDMTRFFMDIDHAASQVLKSLEISRGGEIFAIKSMHSFRIIDLAKVIISFYKKKNKIKYIGERNNEKLLEELLTVEESQEAFENSQFIITNKKFSMKNNLKYYSAKKLANQSLLSSSTAKILNQKEIFKFLQIKKLL